jgi:hypothetical protein
MPCRARHTRAWRLLPISQGFPHTAHDCEIAHATRHQASLGHFIWRHAAFPSSCTSCCHTPSQLPPPCYEQPQTASFAATTIPPCPLCRLPELETTAHRIRIFDRHTLACPAPPRLSQAIQCRDHGEDKCTTPRSTVKRKDGPTSADAARALPDSTLDGGEGRGERGENEVCEARRWWLGFPHGCSREPLGRSACRSFDLPTCRIGIHDLTQTQCAAKQTRSL